MNWTHWSKIFHKDEHLITVPLISSTIYTVCTYLNTDKLKSLTKQSKKMYGSIDFAHLCVRMWCQNLKISYRYHCAGNNSFIQWCDVSVSNNFTATISATHLFLCVCVCVSPPNFLTNYQLSQNLVYFIACDNKATIFYFVPSLITLGDLWAGSNSSTTSHTLFNVW